jgi:putative heme-binding domain-containing protein
LPCHGAVGNGDGPVAMHGFPPPPSFASESSLKMSDGRMFHVVTFGQSYLPEKNMPGYAAQISAEDRWKAILHVRALQETAVRKAAAEQLTQASIEAGKQVFLRLECHKCHTVSADEKPVGPFLGKVAQAYSRQQLHEAIFHPRKTIAEGFLAQVFLMFDGTTHSGFVVEETAEQITIRNSDGNEIILPVDDVDERRTLEKSPMPDDLIKELPETELQSLLDYLKSMAAEPESVAPETGGQENGQSGQDENTEQVTPNSLREKK